MARKQRDTGVFVSSHLSALNRRTICEKHNQIHLCKYSKPTNVKKNLCVLKMISILLKIISHHFECLCYYPPHQYIRTMDDIGSGVYCDNNGNCYDPSDDDYSWNTGHSPCGDDDN